MKKSIFYLSVFISVYSTAQQMYVGENALVHISDGANLEVGGNLDNEGAIQNLGSLSLYGDWTTNNNFNGTEGSLNFRGGEDQAIAPPTLTISELIVNVDGVVTFPGKEYLITDRIDFQFGNVRINDNTEFILGENVSVLGGSNDSYFEGTIIAEGSGIKTFPIGSNGVYAPLTMLDVFGFDSRIAARYIGENSRAPIPGDSLLGVSHRGYWEFELVGGVADETRIQVEFNQEDLSDFKIQNDIRHRLNSPVIAYTDNLNEVWSSLGVSELMDTDSLTFGTLTAQIPLTPGFNKTYLAVGLAPMIPDEGLYFIPEAFSPNAADPDNQTFKVFGQQIVDEEFFLRDF